MLTTSRQPLWYSTRAISAPFSGSYPQILRFISKLRNERVYLLVRNFRHRQTGWGPVQARCIAWLSLTHVTHSSTGSPLVEDLPLTELIHRTNLWSSLNLPFGGKKIEAFWCAQLIWAFCPGCLTPIFECVFFICEYIGNCVRGQAHNKLPMLKNKYFILSRRVFLFPSCLQTLLKSYLCWEACPGGSQSWERPVGQPETRTPTPCFPVVIMKTQLTFLQVFSSTEGTSPLLSTLFPLGTSS